MIRRSLTPSIGTPDPGLPPTRRAGGARRTVSYRITLTRGSVEMPGWALNLSRGGIRAVIDDRVELGESLEVHIDEIEVRRRGRVVWVQDEPDGAIVGIAFDEHIEDTPPGVELESSVELSREAADELGLPEPDDADPKDEAAPGAETPTTPANGTK